MPVHGITGTTTVKQDLLSNVYTELEIKTIKKIVKTVAGDLPANPLRAYINNGLLHLSGLNAGETISLYNASGALVYRSIATSAEMDIPLKVQGVYVVHMGLWTVKVLFE